MARIFKATGKAPIVNANLYSETSPEDSILVCLSKRDVFIIRSYLWPFVQWKTRFVEPIGNNYWVTVDDSTFREFIETCNQLDGKLSEGGFMACLDAGLQEVAAAIRLLANSQCCGETNITVNGGVVSEWTDSEGVTHPIYGTHEPTTNDGVTPPEGFDTYEDYLLNKCQIANLIFDGWLLTLRGMSGFTIFNATALAVLIGAALAGIIAFPPAAIPVMIGLLIVLGVNISVLGSMADELQANKESIVCDLYLSDTVESMTVILSDALDAAISALSLTGIIGTTAKAVALLLVNSDTLSQLLSGVVGMSYPDTDCSGCGPCENVQEIPGGNGTITGQTDTTVDVDATQVGGVDRYDAAVVWNWDFEVPGPCGEEIVLEDITSVPAPETGTYVATIYRGWDTDDNLVYSGNVPPTFPLLGVRRFLVSSAVDVAVTYTFSQTA